MMTPLDKNDVNDVDYQCLHYQDLILASNPNRTLSDIDPCKDCLSIPGCLWCSTPTMTQCLSMAAVNRGECYTENLVPKPHDPATDDRLIHGDDDGKMIQHDPGITYSSKDQCPTTLSTTAAITVLVVTLLLGLFVIGMMTYTCYLQQEKKKKQLILQQHQPLHQLPAVVSGGATGTTPVVSPFHINHDMNAKENVGVMVHHTNHYPSYGYLPNHLPAGTLVDYVPISQSSNLYETNIVQGVVISPLHPC